MKTIELTQGYVTVVDDDDYKMLMENKWCAVNTGGYVYAQRCHPKGKIKNPRIHRVVMGITDPKMCVDHIDHDTLNNQKSNLRVCTSSENNRNRKSRTGDECVYKGVSRHWNTKNGEFIGWRAQICSNGKRKNVGVFETEEEAAKAYDLAARTIHGEFAWLNFPDGL